MRVLVTGGGGFLGGAICALLRERDAEVRSIQRGHYAALEAMGVEEIRGDLADPQSVLQAARGCDAVMHVAAKAGVWGRYADYYAVNVAGTRNVLAACRAQGVRRLVYTSTPSVTFQGEDEDGVDERAPYAGSYLCHYARTKAEAEQLVLAANGMDLATVALRPHLIWGPGDNHLVPRIVQRARAGKLKLVGDGGKLVDCTYIDNAAHAHLCALDRLSPGAACSGKAYYVSNGEPLPMRDIINKILAAGGLPAVEKTVPPGVAYAAGAVLEALYGLLRKTDEPIMTRFVARQLSTAHWFDISAAQRDLGYAPRISINEGMERLRAALKASPMA